MRARVDNAAATRPGPVPPIQADRMMARKKIGDCSASGCTRSVRPNAAMTLKTATPYRKDAEECCIEMSIFHIPGVS